MKRAMWQMLAVMAFSLGLFAVGDSWAGPPAPSVHVGDAAPLFVLPAINSEPALRMTARAAVSLSDLTGVNPPYPADWVLVHFTDKAGGAVDLPVLDKVARKYANRGLKVVAVVSDRSDIPVLSAWIEGLKLSYPALHDRHGVVASRYGITQFPITMIVDKDGRIDALGAPTASMEAELDSLVATRIK